METLKNSPTLTTTPKFVGAKSSEFLGVMPPHSIDMESSVLGAIMLEKDAITCVAEILRPESFYLETNQEIYRAIVDLLNRSEPIDIRTVVNQLRKNGKLEFVGGPYYVISMTSQINSAANIEYYARSLVEFSLRRDIISTATSIQRRAYDNTQDVFDVLDAAEQSLFDVTNTNIKKGYKDIKNLFIESIKQIEQSRGKEDGLTGVPSGFMALDRITAGWQNSDFIVIAARPGMGKSAFALSFLRNAAIDHECPVAIFSLEMADVQLMNRLISAEAEIDNQAIKTGRLSARDWEQLMKRTARLSQAPIYIDDTPALSIFELRAKCRRLKSKCDIKLVVVDYLQLMCGETHGKTSNREQEIASISRALKNMAKELDIPVVALSQLSRAVEHRGGSKKPQLSDLRESGGIEQDADIVLMLYRPEYYGLTEDENGESTLGVAEVIIAKHRNGALDTVKLHYNNRYTKFADLDSFSYQDLGAEELGGFEKFSSGVHSEVVE